MLNKVPAQKFQPLAVPPEPEVPPEEYPPEEISYVDIAEEVEEAQPESVPVAESLPYNYQEAPGSANTYLMTPQGARIQLTARASTPRQALDELVAAMDYAQKAHGILAEALARPQTSDVFSGAFAAPKTAPKPTAPQTNAVPPKPADEYKSMNPYPAKTMEIELSSSGIKLLFKAENRRYADVTVFRKDPKNLVSLFQIGKQITPEQLSKPGAYSVNYLVHWENSTNVDQNGKPYKNVTKITPAA